MAITGLVVMPLGEGMEDVQTRLLEMEGLSFYGPAQDGSLVFVLEAPSAELEDRLRIIGSVKGVGAVLPTSVNLEDELESAGRL